MTNLIKKQIALFFAILFIAFTAAPTLLVAVNDSVDVSVYFGSAEEEEQEKENEKTFELIILDSRNLERQNYLSFGDENIAYFYKTYPKPHLNLISPPPDVT